MAHKPVGNSQSVSLTSTATTSTAISHQSEYVRVVAVGASAHVAIGTYPLVSASNYYVREDGEATLSCGRPSSQRVVGITTGSTTVIDFPEGTGAPFAVGDTVTLSVTNQDYFDFSHKPVQSIDNTRGVDGYYNTRLTVNHDSSGVATAFQANNWGELRASFKVGTICPGGDTGKLYIQQVQVSGDA